MPASTPLPTQADLSLDFALLQQPAARTSTRNRAALWWMAGLLLLLCTAVVWLLLYLNRFEADEAARRRSADAQWLEQSVTFHFKRLEEDLQVLARQAALGRTHAPPVIPKAGLLWREAGVVLASGWLPAGRQTPPRLARWRQDMNASPENAEALQTMRLTTEGLRRAAYAGPMEPEAAAGGSVVWLAVPYVERGLWLGDYLAAVSVSRAVDALLPDWFTLEHSVEVLAPLGVAEAPSMGSYRVALNLPGTDLQLRVAQLLEPSTTVPRLFFGVALLFLVALLLALWFLRRDFIKRQRIQAQLRTQVALRSAMENSVTTGLRAWDRSGRILYVNQAFSRLVGYPVADLIGRKPPFPYWPDGQHEALRSIHDGVLAQGTDDVGIEVQFQHQDGHLIDVLVHEAPLTTAQGVQVGWMSSVLDISERKRAQRMAAQQQERLEASGRLVAVGEVASTLAHELNQPLGALSSFANGLRNRLQDHTIELAEVQPVVERMARLAERAGAIIQRVNAFARQRELVFARVDLAQVLERVLASQGDVGPVHLEAPRGLPAHWVQADELLLEHLLANLLRNALDWAVRGPQASLRAEVRVQLRARPDAGVVELAFADTGPGVPEAEREAIFNAFVSRKDGGMGMGLAICRSIAEAHHGRIEVLRDEDLGGARFVVTLPMADASNLGTIDQPRPEPS
jgi:two-component system sensor histidine kinase DctS